MIDLGKGQLLLIVFILNVQPFNISCTLN